MKCADPVLCYLDSKGNRKFRNFSFARASIQGIPESHIVFDCGKCLSCRKKRAYELAARCVLHASLFNENCFLTLTYDEKREGYHNEFEYSDIQKFKKRLRAAVWRKHKRRVDLFNVHEYGKNGKKHWHLVLFGYDFSDKLVQSRHGEYSLYTSGELQSLWKFGFSTVGSVTEASAMYQAQYMEKDFKNGNYNGGRKSHSRHSGIGRCYFEKHYRQILSLGYVPFNGRRLPVPRYFRKIAHKHYCHFYERSAFYDTAGRRALYREFKGDEANKEIADLFLQFLDRSKAEALERVEEWRELISLLTPGEEPDFLKANRNALHDLINKNRMERF